MVRLIVRIPVTMSVVRSNGTTASYDRNSRTGNGYTVTLTADNSTVIRDLEANSAGLGYDQMDARVSAAVRELVRGKNMRMNYIGEEEHYFEDQDDYDDPNDPGDGGIVSYGVPAHGVDDMTLSVDYMGVGPNAPAPVLDRLLRGAIRAPDSMYRKWDIFPVAWSEEDENCMVTQLFVAVTERVFAGSRKRKYDQAAARAPKYSMEEWQTLTHDIELLAHPARSRCTRYSDRGEWNVNRSSRLNWTRSQIGSTISCRRRARKIWEASSEPLITVATTGSRCCSAAGHRPRTGAGPWRPSCNPDLSCFAS